MAQPPPNPRLSNTAVALGALLGGWLIACEVWLKILARQSGCPGLETVADAAPSVLRPVTGCPGVELGAGVQFGPTLRAGLTPLDVSVPAGLGPVIGLAWFALATVLSIVVLRWSWRVPSDALALGVVWAGAIIHGLPRLLLGGHTLAEFSVGPASLCLGDLWMIWGVVWIAWRFIAEWRES